MLFPVASKLKPKLKGGRVQFMPQNVLEAVQKAIKDSSIDLTLEVSRPQQAYGTHIRADVLGARENYRYRLQFTVTVTVSGQASQA